MESYKKNWDILDEILKAIFENVASVNTKIDNVRQATITQEVSTKKSTMKKSNELSMQSTTSALSDGMVKTLE